MQMGVPILVEKRAKEEITRKRESRRTKIKNLENILQKGLEINPKLW